eukprot:jgi/Undpi1/2315/HiC_scaffold_13.g05698.m1
MSIEYEKICASGIYVAGLQQPWESILSVSRVVATIVTVSIISSWYSRRGIGRLILLFLHWIGGLVHLLSGIVLAQMVLNCWVGDGVLAVVKALKFLELVGSNLVAVTNLAICSNLAFIVHSHRTMSRIKNGSSFRMGFFFLAVSVGFAATSMPFWDVWLLAGTTFHPRGLRGARDRWASISFFVLEAAAAFVMTVIVLLLLMFRRSELREVWRLHRRIKLHVALTTIALLVDIQITVAGVLIVVNGGPFWLIIVAWILRYVHIALDTLVLYSAHETPVFYLGSDCEDIETVGLRARNPYVSHTERLPRYCDRRHSPGCPARNLTAF